MPRTAPETTITGGTSTVAERQQRRRRRRQRMRSANIRGHIQVSGGLFAGPGTVGAAAVVTTGLVNVLLPGHSQRRGASDRGRAADDQQYVVHLQPLGSPFLAAFYAAEMIITDYMTSCYRNNAVSEPFFYTRRLHK